MQTAVVGVGRHVAVRNCEPIYARANTVKRLAFPVVFCTIVKYKVITETDIMSESIK